MTQTFCKWHLKHDKSWTFQFAKSGKWRYHDHLQTYVPLTPTRSLSKTRRAQTHYKEEMLLRRQLLLHQKLQCYFNLNLIDI